MRPLRLISYSETSVYCSRPAGGVVCRTLSPRRVATIHRAVLARKVGRLGLAGLVGSVRAAFSVSAGVL